ncbi:MAG: hypothetical protein Ct9H300mP8_05790 [Gammaproteobacteria bacterium]|nr:MAG: hypothetical protein Ct9H300mP8_05790 [Gammaproteobacteria bacterium]
MDGIVLATGGGVVLREENRHVLSDRGHVAYLTSPVSLLAERTRKDRRRPLLRDVDPATTLETSRAKRAFVREHRGSYLRYGRVKHSKSRPGSCRWYRESTGATSRKMAAHVDIVLDDDRAYRVLIGSGAISNKASWGRPSAPRWP